ncbi:MAG: MazG nucleotide pyrophosphohydrolase [Candidatus Peregrinibacteria bacterium GW2011_GWC2_39_14]|nr:MAG: MazG nucleotide pyrophosphohydrolase [Candidatus Peregrinibacteria bacterium GW2011_GWC2_39_14]
MVNMKLFLTKVKEYSMNANKNKHQCLIIGSFRKHYSQIVETINFFHANNIEVLSPKISTILNPEDEFVIFDYDPRDADIRQIEDKVLEKMHNTDFVYIVNPDGYIGQSTSFEIGYCHGKNLKIFAMEDSSELCSRYIHAVLKPNEIIKKLKELKN